MTRLLLVCLGGALGSGARYLTGLAVPHATVVVNLVGSFAIALVMERIAPSSELRYFVVTGILGGFTTYSAFNQETLQWLRAGAAGAALLNLGVTVVGCLAAGAAGIFVARALE
ncbi:MAG TPA: CrcB family protein [Thermoanaerobaculia bacterium]|jgi:CrcB protein